jgi:hypothetical protein
VEKALGKTGDACRELGVFVELTPRRMATEIADASASLPAFARLGQVVAEAPRGEPAALTSSGHPTPRTVCRASSGRSHSQITRFRTWSAGRDRRGGERGAPTATVVSRGPRSVARTRSAHARPSFSRTSQGGPVDPLPDVHELTRGVRKGCERGCLMDIRAAEISHSGRLARAGDCAAPEGTGDAFGRCPGVCRRGGGPGPRGREEWQPAKLAATTTTRRSRSP